MKMTEMIYRTVVAFEPKRRPWPALAALAMILFALVMIVYLGGAGVAGAITKLL